MLDPHLARAYKTAETLRFLTDYWSTHSPPALTKEGQSALPYLLMQNAPAFMGAARVPGQTGLINQWLSKLLGEGPLSQIGLGLLERHWTKPVRPSLSLPQLSTRNTVRGDIFGDALNQLRVQYGQAPLPIGSMAQQ